MSSSRSVRAPPPRQGVSKEVIATGCPYDKYHYITANKLDDHVKKCRYNYQVKLYKEKGLEIPVVNCMYNHTHEVYITEWTYHMDRCPNRKIHRSYQLQVGELKHKYPNLFPYSMEDFALDEKELKEMYAGLHVNQVMGTYQWGKAFTIEEVKYPKTAKQKEAEEKGRALAKEVEEMLNEDKKEEPAKAAANVIEYTQEELDEWNKPYNGPAFSYMLSASFPKPTWHKYPPWMNKAQRRGFEKWSTRQLEKLEAQKKAEAEIAGEGERAPAGEGASAGEGAAAE